MDFEETTSEAAAIEVFDLSQNMQQTGKTMTIKQGYPLLLIAMYCTVQLSSTRFISGLQKGCHQRWMQKYVAQNASSLGNFTLRRETKIAIQNLQKYVVQNLAIDRKIPTSFYSYCQTV